MHECSFLEMHRKSDGMLPPGVGLVQELNGLEIHGSSQLTPVLCLPFRTTPPRMGSQEDSRRSCLSAQCHLGPEVCAELPH